MKKINTATNQDNTASFYITVDGDICDTIEDAEITGAKAEIVVNGFFAGSLDEMRAAARCKYDEMTAL